MKRPICTARTVARRSPRLRASNALNTRPPSIGIAGRRLKPASRRLAHMRRLTIAPAKRVGGQIAAPDAKPARAMIRASTALARGPASAMASSSAGAPGRPEISETPPMGKSTMSRTIKPRRRATKLWDSSWTTMQTKRAAIQMNPSASERAVVLPPVGTITRTTSSGKVQWMRIGTPLTLPTRSDRPISSALSACSSPG